MAPFARLIDEVNTGTAGRVRMVSLREHRFPFLEKVGDWNRFEDNTGGTLVEKCCHFFDLMNQVMPGRPERVYASGSQMVNHLDESYVEHQHFLDTVNSLDAEGRRASSQASLSADVLSVAMGVAGSRSIITGSAVRLADVL